MVTRGSGPWQQSAAYGRDQQRVDLLVRQVGRSMLCFTAYDVARNARSSETMRLEESVHLYRHLRDMPDDVLRRVPSALRVAGETSAEVRDVRRYVLAERFDEWGREGGSLTDRERVLVGLWIAGAVLRDVAVPTIAVTRVLQLVSPLALSSTVQMHTVLTQLAEDATVVVRARTAEGEDGVRWQCVASLAHPKLETWLEGVRAAMVSEGGAVLSVFPSRNNLVKRLVAVVIDAGRSKAWPAGQLVGASDISREAAVNPSVRALLERVHEARGGLGRALQEASRSRSEHLPPVARVVMPGASRTILYDVPSLAGSDARLLRADAEQLAAHCTENRLLLWDRERRLAASLAREGGATGSLGTVRQYSIGMEWVAQWATLTRLEQSAGAMGAGGKALLKEIRKRLYSHDHLSRVAAQSEDAAHAVLRLRGIDPLTWAVTTLRPYVTARQFVEFCPPGTFGDDTPPTVLSRSVTLTRWANPAHTRRQDPDPDRAASVVVDRVEAMLQLAERGVSHGLTWLQRGAQLLGPCVRDARLVHPLLAPGQSVDTQLSALAALVLLGDAKAETWAMETLATPSEPETIRASLFALHVLQRDALVIPAPVRCATNPLVRAAVRAVSDARQRGRWLLQR
jgi:hypothetical protein